MAFPLATGGTTPAIWPVGSTGNGLAAAGFVPEIWSGKLVEKFYDATVLSAISNTDYEGEIKNQGDKVKIRTKPTITISDYRADGALTLQRPVGSTIELNIDQGKYFAVILDDVMEIQSDINNMAMWADDASEQFKITIDTAVLAGILNQATAVENRGTTAGRISAGINLGVTTTPLSLVDVSPGVGEVEVLDMILRLGQALDEQNIPESGRWLVLPTWAATLIKKSELRQAYLSGDGVSMLRNGRIGMVDRFTIYVSNLLPAGVAGGLAAGEYAVYAGHPHGLTFASQFSKVETLKAESTFGEILRGLQVYGYKVIDGDAIAQAIVSKAA
jgi:hypothetical protein